MPPSGGSKFKGPRQRPLLPLRAVHVLKPPALPGDTYCSDAAMEDNPMMYGSIPAGGEGTRMQPLGFSKELLLVEGRAVIEHLIERMLLAGIDDIFINTSSDKLDLVTYLSSKSPYSSKCVFMFRERRGLLDAVVQPRQFLRDDDEIYFGLPDTVWYPKNCFSQLAAFEGAVSLGLFDTGSPEKFDSVYIDNRNIVQSIRVKDPLSKTKWTWGIGRIRVGEISKIICHDDVILKKQILMGEALDIYSRHNVVTALRFEGSAYIDIGEPQEYKRVEQFISKYGK
jgi:dTDP-glucose pyrophosphorylase